MGSKEIRQYHEHPICWRREPNLAAGCSFVSENWRNDIPKRFRYNSANEDFDSTFKSNEVVYNSGEVNWIPPGFSLVLCLIKHQFDKHLRNLSCKLQNGYHLFPVSVLSWRILIWQILDSTIKSVISRFQTCVYFEKKIYIYILNFSLVHGLITNLLWIYTSLSRMKTKVCRFSIPKFLISFKI